MNCNEAATFLNSYLDQELDVEQTRCVWRHVATCQHCDDRFQFAFKMKHLLYKHCIHVQIPTYLRESIVEQTNYSLALFPLDNGSRK